MNNLFSSFFLFFLKKIKTDKSRYLLLKLLYKKNGFSLTAFQSFNHDRFFIYKVNDIALPDVSLNWYKSFQHYKEDACKISFYDYLPKTGDIVLDIGAGIGEESVVLARDLVGASGKVYAIEANPEVYRILKQVTELNRFENIKTFNIAMNEVNEPISLVDEDEGYISGTIGTVPSSETKSFVVEGVRLDTFLEQENIDRVDLLKCNIEGAERFVINTIGQGNIHKIKNVAIACHDFRYYLQGVEFFKTKDYVISFLKENGFEVKTQQTGQGWIDDWVYGRNTRLS